MKDKECNCCEDAKFGVAYIDPESGLLWSKIDTGMKLPKGKKFIEKIGEYYQEDKENGDSSSSGDTTEETTNTDTTTLDVNKTKKRVIIYQLED